MRGPYRHRQSDMKARLKICLTNLITALAVAGFLNGCHAAWQTDAVADVTRPESILLTKRSGQGHIHSLLIEVSGAIEGGAKIDLIADGKPYRTEVLSGSVKFSWENDWYDDVAEVRYLPGTTTGGNLRLRYRFGD